MLSDSEDARRLHLSGEEASYACPVSRLLEAGRYDGKCRQGESTRLHPGVGVRGGSMAHLKRSRRSGRTRESHIGRGEHRDQEGTGD